MKKKSTSANRPDRASAKATAAHASPGSLSDGVLGEGSAAATLPTAAPDSKQPSASKNNEIQLPQSFVDGSLESGADEERTVTTSTVAGTAGTGSSIRSPEPSSVTILPIHHPDTPVSGEAFPPVPGPVAVSLLTEHDLFLFNEGTHHRMFEKLGSHPGTVDGVSGTFFAVWAPEASAVSVIGDFNDWTKGKHPLRSRGSSGIWEEFLPDVSTGASYKYHVVSRHHGYSVDKADPYAFANEEPPEKASTVTQLDYNWGDAAWMSTRGAKNRLDAPMSIYEVHLGSWRRGENNRFLTYREMAPLLADYVKEMGFTHVEILPVMEHPFYGSWGYQVTGFFAPSKRFGTPQDFMFLVDHLHQNGISVILDWVPSHFPSDEHGLGYFDGTHLYEHADPRKGFHPDWNSLIFNYGRPEVRSFLLSSALFWAETFHADALRVDAVASMLYLDYSRKADEWIPNEFGGRENLEAIDFLRRLNQDLFQTHPEVQTIAEESTAWPMVSRPTYLGGLGFGMKWDMGWMHDTLGYVAKPPEYRKYHHDLLTFRMMYAYTEHFVLALSHDEVVHGKGSLLNKMPEDEWRKFANLRLLFGYMFAQPGKKLMFMGGEIAQWREWNHDAQLDWHLLDSPRHAGVQRWLRDLNTAYRNNPALHELDSDPNGFEWIDCCDVENNVLSLLRKGSSPGDVVVCVFNFSPLPQTNYRVGVPVGGPWREILNSDARDYGGSGYGNFGVTRAAPLTFHGRPHTLNLTLPPLGALFLVPEASTTPSP